MRFNIKQIDDVDASLSEAVEDHYTNHTKSSLPDTIYDEARNAYDLFISRKALQVTKPLLKGKLGSAHLESLLRRESEINGAVSDVFQYAREQLMREFRFQAYVEEIGLLVADKAKYNSESMYEDFYAQLQVEGIYQ